MRNTLHFAWFTTFGVAMVMPLGACSDSFGHSGSTAHLAVSLVGSTSTRNQLLPISFDVPTPFTINVTAQKQDGTVDTSFNGFVRISVKPGNVVAVTGSGTSGRNVQLVNGVATNVGVGVLSSFGTTNIWAEDTGYSPADPDRKPPPQCSDGIDNNGNGEIDFPADPGCAFANDDSEDGGSYASGASGTIYFKLPRIADVRGVSQGGTGTSFPNQQVLIDTGWNPDSNAFDFSTVVTRISSDGFYATDLGDKRGYSSVFAFNFSAPPLMRICDRLKYYGGTASDFFGFTEVGYPTWELEEWDPNVRDCLVPEPTVFAVSDLAAPPTISTTPALTKNVAGLVRVLSGGTVSIHIARNFGPGFPKKPDYTATTDASNCDLNGDGKIDFTTGPEKTCSDACTADPECSEYSSYIAQNQFQLVVSDTNPPPSGSARSVLADGSSDPEFDPVALHKMKTDTISSFTGTLRYFSGGAQYTIEARCSDDIVLSGKPKTSNLACVHPRTISDNDSASN